MTSSINRKSTNAVACKQPGGRQRIAQRFIAGLAYPRVRSPARDERISASIPSHHTLFLSQRDNPTIARRFNAGTGSSRDTSPAGTADRPILSGRCNQPVAQRCESAVSPVHSETAEGGQVSKPAWRRQTKTPEEAQPSLWDELGSASQPGVETPGYYRTSLRDTKNKKVAPAASESAWCQDSFFSALEGPWKGGTITTKS